MKDKTLKNKILRALDHLERDLINNIGPTPLRHFLNERVAEMRRETKGFDQDAYERGGSGFLYHKSWGKYYLRDVEITTKDGLLWAGEDVINLPEADSVARAFGFTYAEGMVKELEDSQ